MHLDSDQPISESCAHTVEPALDTLLRLGITQQEVVEHLSRALGIVRCVLDYRQSIPRKQLAILGRTLWKRLPELPGLPPETVQQARSLIMACVDQLRGLPESAVTPAEHGGVSLPSEALPRPSALSTDSPAAPEPAKSLPRGDESPVSSRDIRQRPTPPERTEWE